MKIEENLNNGTVTINGFELEGELTDTPCQKCSTSQVYNDSFDAYFCPACNAWLEKKCTDKSCSFCRKRPEKPLPEPDD